jgi:hypothetical protein
MQFHIPVIKMAVRQKFRRYIFGAVSKAGGRAKMEAGGLACAATAMR